MRTLFLNYTVVLDMGQQIRVQTMLRLNALNRLMLVQRTIVLWLSMGFLPSNGFSNFA